MHTPLPDFDIEYADRPITVTPTAVQRKANTEQYKALSQIGQAVFSLGTQLQHQQNELDYSAGQRRINEDVNAALENLTGDKDSDKEVVTKLQQDISGIKYDNGKVNRALEIYRNKTMPQITERLNQRSQQLAQQRVRDGFQAEGQYYLANGDLTSYYTILDRRLAAKEITPETHAYLEKTAVNDSWLQQARNLMVSDSGEDRNQAVDILNTLPEISTVEMTTEQKEYRTKLLKTAKKMSQEAADATIAGVVVQKDNLRNATILEKQQAAQEMKQTLVSGGVTGDQLNRWFDSLDEWSGGDKDATEQYDPQIYAALQAQCDLEPERLTEGMIYSFVGQGQDGGISIQQARSLAELRQKNIDKIGKVQIEIHKRYQDILKAMHSNGDFEGFGDSEQDASMKYAELANRLTIFANTNKDASAKDFEDFFYEITTPERKSSWLKRIIYIGKPIAGLRTDIKAGFVGSDRLEMTNKIRSYVRGATLALPAEEKEVMINGQKWKLIEKGETPDKDVYERVE